MTTLEILKIELGVTDKDQLLQRLIDKATKKIEAFTKRDTAYVSTVLQEQVVSLATILYNLKGTEGLKSQGYSGVSESYVEDIPEDLKRELYGHRLLKRSDTV